MSAAAAVETSPAMTSRLLTPIDAPLPRRSAAELLALVEAAGLTGRGGAAFPTARKLAAVAQADRTLVVANGVEGEPASWKDKVLLAQNPHLVIDGAVAAARIVGSDEVVFAVGRANTTVQRRLARALRERDDGVAVSVQTLPDRFVAGEESAVLHAVNGGPAKPTIDRPYERGVLVQSVETLANLALVARYGSEWFRERGTSDEPGTVLATILGAVRNPGVVEVDLGTPIREVLLRCGGLSALPQALLIGGYFGSWVRAHDVLDLPFTDAALQPLGASLGARAIVVLSQDACGLAESARVARYLADESAGQCGPCVFGLAAMADALERLDVDRLARLAPQVARRGACAHPTGATRFVASAVDVFAAEVRRHGQGDCCGASHPHVLPLGASRDWR
ncbi:MAG TPA: NADH-ubiquinone oxidoreductase-F iron-sulfur binding region domain-containing protein [Gaiellaceae bacterium]|nr:NADH-ubiquinone oxidoreductase-F iron-sulfur binding region domain-containing protein [Gaiellaceae bacterium]